MDKEEFRIKLDEINTLVEKKDYKSAMEIVDSIDWRRVKNVRILCTVGEIYAANRRYKDSREIFLLAYHRAPVGKTILYRLIEVSLKIGDLDEAMEYYTDFVNAAPNDNTRYILKYKIYSARKAPIEQQIEILEQYKEKEYTERWSYELAKLYYKAGDVAKCVDTCDDISLWFREGKYVIKCLELKQRLAKLTPSQQEIYNNYYRPSRFMQDMTTPEVFAYEEPGVKPQKSEAVKETRQEDAAEEEGTEQELGYTREIKVPSRASRARRTAMPEESEAEETVKEPSAKASEKKVKTPSLDETIDSISKTTTDIQSDEAFQQKLTRGIKDIFRGGRKSASEEEQMAASEAEKPPVVGKINFADVIPEVQEEDRNLDVKELEPETAELEQKMEEKDEYEDESLAGEARVPKPKSFSSFHMPMVNLNQSFKVEDLPISDKFTIDLEQTILEAAQSQGIEVPDIEPEKEEAPKADTGVIELKSDEPEVAHEEENTETEEEISEEEAFGPGEEIPQESALEPEEEIPQEKVLEPEEEIPEEKALEPEKEIPQEKMPEPVEEISEEEAFGPGKEVFEEEIFVPEEEALEEVSEPEQEPLEAETFETEIPEEVLPEIDISVLEEKLSEIELSEAERLKLQEQKLKIEIPELEEEPEISVSDPEKEQPEPEEVPQLEEVEKELSEEEELMRFIDEKNQEPNADARDLIPRADQLDEEEVKLFKYFSSVPGVKEQLVEALKDVQMAAADKTSNTGNIIVMGNRGCGKTTLARILTKAICRELNIPAAKAAKVTAEQLRNQDMARIVDRLAGGFLLIQNVNQLDAEIVDQLNHAMEFRTDGLTVILEDEKIGMRKFIARNPKFIKKFTSTIAIPVFTNDELVNFAKIYTNELGYKIDEMGILALYTLISNNQKEDEPMTVGTVKILVDNAIAKAESGTRKLQRNLSKTRTDREGKVLLYEKDFK